jgi:flavin reductase (DIM6/NTAB) family NADH-FMN oxidoreductase RutF
MPVSETEFRAALGRFASGVTVVTARDARGNPKGITVSSFASLSLVPPLVLIAIGKEASAHEALSGTDRFAVNVLGEAQEAISRKFAMPAGKVDQFEGVPTRRGVGDVPLLEDTLATIECRIVERYPGGDHTIFVGAVDSATTRDGLPLLYFTGQYGRLAHDRQP